MAGNLRTKRNDLKSTALMDRIPRIEIELAGIANDLAQLEDFVNQELEASSASSSIIGKTITAAYTTLTVDSILYIDASGGAFDVTLNTPTVNKTLAIKRIDDTLANVVSIVGTIDGETDWKLHTKNEAYLLFFDTTNGWQVVEHKTKFYKNTATLTVTGTGSNPTKGTVVHDKVILSREGRFAVYTYQFRQSVAGGAGSGDDLLTLAYGLTADLTDYPLFATVGMPTNTSNAYGGFPSLGGMYQAATSQGYVIGILPYSTTRFRLIVTNTNAYSTSFPRLYPMSGYFGTVFYMYVSFKVPILGWKD